MDEVEDENEDEPLTSSGPKKGPNLSPSILEASHKAGEYAYHTFEPGKRAQSYREATPPYKYLLTVSPLFCPRSSSQQHISRNNQFSDPISITDSQIALTKLKDESTTSSDSGEESCEGIELPTTERVPR